MIEVTQKNRHGTVEIIAQYETEEEFGKAYWPSDVEEQFATKHNMVGSKEVEVRLVDTFIYVRVPVFKKVAYNEKGKILDVGHLIGIARKYNERYILRRNYRWFCGYKRHKRHVRGSYMRQMHTTPERRWTHAWDDEEFAPKNGYARRKRSAHNLPESWDDYWRHNEKNWKRHRKHQWWD